MIGLYENLCIMISLMKINVGNNWNNHDIWIFKSEFYSAGLDVGFGFLNKTLLEYLKNFEPNS
jgi:hypothetical protein